MAKKKTQTRRVPRAADPRMYGDGKPSAQAAATTGAAPTAAGAARGIATGVRTGAARAADVVADYRYVSKDLRRLGITAAALFALMIALGFILR